MTWQSHPTSSIPIPSPRHGIKAVRLPRPATGRSRKDIYLSVIARSALKPVIARSIATWQSHLFYCHCEERSDVAISLDGFNPKPPPPQHCVKAVRLPRPAVRQVSQRHIFYCHCEECSDVAISPHPSLRSAVGTKQSRCKGLQGYRDCFAVGSQ